MSDLERPCEDPVGLEHERRGAAGSGHVEVERLQLLRLEPVQARLAERREDPDSALRPVVVDCGRIAPARRDRGEVRGEPLLDGLAPTGLDDGVRSDLLEQFVDALLGLLLGGALDVALVGPAVRFRADGDPGMPLSVVFLRDLWIRAARGPR